ncbi:cytochrome d ubiquinol oxidase, subunit I [Streptomyces bingchenggensis BCW-1]|uniref:Cytochrome d ubiquinol oxidase, subunit I n=1 Tax=Streptomyces bingchenggensis (strain BCW-1) TaxID=749414 RepID=D7BT70_STRBB|nr:MULTISPECIES: cytochrome ubiquinol oxidase subunit I [Streptomyces]ADI05285.1 cytochrome d ubiquinol oxidase, subunit I [Streptomyces bingchenggensis BCW-1]
MFAVPLAHAATEGDLSGARAQMGFSLAWHIVVACLGVGLPLLTLIAEWLGWRTGDPALRILARRWARGMGVLFAVGAVSGTILSFELGLLWPGLMGRYGQVIGLPFALEGIAFFIEAIFLGVYLYAWDRLPPGKHLLTGVPIVIAGVASAFFVVCANAWMNQPRGFELSRDGRVVSVDPWAAMFNPAAPPQTTHMILAALMVAAFLTASVYAVALLRGRRDRYHRAGFFIPFTVGAVVTPFQLVVGDWAARFVAHYQPAKLAAMEGVYRTGDHVPLTVLGISNGHSGLKYGLEIPSGLSLLIGYSPDTVVRGLSEVPRSRWPAVTGVHLAFDLMVGAGLFLLLMGGWLALAWWLRRRTGADGVLSVPGTRAFLTLAVLTGPAAVVALECGWVVTELGRQPWVVQGVMTVRDAVNPAPGLLNGLWLVLVVYFGMTVATVYVLRRLARDQPVPIAPQESDVPRYPVT